MSTWIRLTASACGVAFLTGAAPGCMRGVTYRMPMPGSLTLGTIKPEPSAGMASAGQPATPATRPATGDRPRSGGEAMMPLSMSDP